MKQKNSLKIVFTYNIDSKTKISEKSVSFSEITIEIDQGKTIIRPSKKQPNSITKKPITKIEKIISVEKFNALMKQKNSKDETLNKISFNKEKTLLAIYRLTEDLNKTESIFNVLNSIGFFSKKINLASKIEILEQYIDNSRFEKYSKNMMNSRHKESEMYYSYQNKKIEDNRMLKFNRGQIEKLIEKLGEYQSDDGTKDTKSLYKKLLKKYANKETEDIEDIELFYKKILKEEITFITKELLLFQEEDFDVVNNFNTLIKKNVFEEIKQFIHIIKTIDQAKVENFESNININKNQISYSESDGTNMVKTFKSNDKTIKSLYKNVQKQMKLMSSNIENAQKNTTGIVMLKFGSLSDSDIKNLEELIKIFNEKSKLNKCLLNIYQNIENFEKFILNADFDIKAYTKHISIYELNDVKLECLDVSQLRDMIPESLNNEACRKIKILDLKGSTKMLGLSSMLENDNQSYPFLNFIKSQIISYIKNNNSNLKFEKELIDNILKNMSNHVEIHHSDDFNDSDDSNHELELDSGFKIEDEENDINVKFECFITEEYNHKLELTKARSSLISELLKMEKSQVVKNKIVDCSLLISDLEKLNTDSGYDMLSELNNDIFNINDSHNINKHTEFNDENDQGDISNILGHLVE